MAATFTNAARYQIEAVLKTPLRAGGIDKKPSEILRNTRGNAFLQGSTIAGALRSWLCEHRGDAAAKTLFGVQGQSGSLILSDAVFDGDAPLQIRPRVRIDGKTGTAEQGGKFDVAHVGVGAVLRFTITWLGTAETAGQFEDVERMLAALNGGAIRLGAQKSDGFGRVTLTVRKRIYNMADADDREAWLDDRDDGVPLVLPEWNDPRFVVFTLRGHADSILIKSAAAEHTDDGSYTGNLQEGGRAILPGSSIKGAVRAKPAAIAALMHLPDETVTGLFGRPASAGSGGIAGAVCFEDMLLSREQHRKIARIRIDRLTGGVMRGGLFFEDPLSAPVTMQILAPAEQGGGCALLLYALRDLGLGLYNLGSGGAVGRGYLTIDTITAEAPDGRTVTLTFDAERNCTAVDPDGLFAAWRGAWEARA